MDMHVRMESLRENYAASKGRKKKPQMISKDFETKLFDEIVSIDSNLMEQRRSSLKKWNKVLFKVLCKKSKKGEDLRINLLSWLDLEQKHVVDYVVNKALRKLKTKKALENEDTCLLKNLAFWMHGSDPLNRNYATPARA